MLTFNLNWIIYPFMFLLTACTGGHVQEKSAKPPLRSGIVLQNMDTLVKPGNDFNAYANGTWIKNTTIPADKAAYGAVPVVRDKVQEEVKGIIEKAASSAATPGSEEQKLGDFYEAFINTKARDSLGLLPLTAALEKIKAIQTPADLASYFAYAWKTGNIIPFYLEVSVDMKNPKAHTLYTWQDGLGLPEREYYFLNDEKSTSIRNKYVIHIENMLRLADITGAKEKARQIMVLETTLASHHMKKEQTRNPLLLYNKYAMQELSTLMPHFAWNNFLKEAGLEKQDSLVVSQVEYTKALDTIFQHTPLDTWKAYLQWSLIHGSAPYLTTALDKEDFEFYDKVLDGLQQPRPLWRRGVALVNNHMGEIIGKLYVKQYFSPQAKERMTHMVSNLLKAYENSIKQLDWMSEETKKQALIKLGKISPKVGYPNKWRDYSGLQVVKNDLYGNVQRAILFEYYRNINKLGKPVDRDEWFTTPQTVNAFYNPSQNEIVFPAARLQPPFFDIEAEDAINYGAIGGVIGHEIGHAFDDQGSAYDGDGALRNWWTAKDKNEFKKRTAALVSQYNSYKVFDDLYVNGEFTLGENIGDLGGLSIALKAYHISLNGKPAPVLDGFTGDQRVFIGWAQMRLIKAREEWFRNLINSDPHSPEKFRVNGVVRNIPEFYTAFDVQPGDSLYLAPEQRVKIW